MAQARPEVLSLCLAGESVEERVRQWLTPREHARYLSLCLPGRRRDWLAGRVAAKEAVRRRHAVGGPSPFQEIEIVAADDGRPGYLLEGRPGPYGLSISHAAGRALVALSGEAGQRVGIDLEEIEDRGRGFEDLALSTEEKRRLSHVHGHARSAAVTLIWVLKEALLKATGVGLGLPLPDLTVCGDLRPAGAHAFHPRGVPGAKAVTRVHTFQLGTALAACVALQAAAA